MLLEVQSGLTFLFKQVALRLDAGKLLLAKWCQAVLPILLCLDPLLNLKCLVNYLGKLSDFLDGLMVSFFKLFHDLERSMLLAKHSVGAFLV